MKEERKDTFASLKLKNYRRFFLGGALSNVGDWMQETTQMWLLLTLTTSPIILGTTAALMFAPLLLFGPWAGALADRIEHKRLLLITQTLLAIQAIALGIIVFTNQMTTPTLVASMVILGTLVAFNTPTKSVAVKDLVEPDLVRNAMSLGGVSSNIARLAGPALAGVMIATVSTGWVFIVNGLTFIIMVIVILQTKFKHGTKATKTEGGVLHGIRYIKGRTDVILVLLIVGTVAMLVLNFQMTSTTMVIMVFKSTATSYGLLLSAMAVGAILGALYSARLNVTSIKQVAVSAVALSIIAIGAGFAPNVWIFGITVFITGGMITIMLTSASVYLVNTTEYKIRGRVMGIYMALTFGTTLIGAPLVGLIGSTIGVRTSIILPATIAGILTLVFTWLLRTTLHSQHTTSVA